MRSLHSCITICVLATVHMCLSFNCMSQSISCRNIMLSSCSPVQIYIYYCYAKQLDVL